jgi:hypothetical protein
MRDIAVKKGTDGAVEVTRTEKADIPAEQVTRAIERLRLELQGYDAQIAFLNGKREETQRELGLMESLIV